MVGDREYDFEDILNETQAKVRAYIAGLGVPLYEVDDLAQEVYIVLYRNMDKIPTEASPIQWLKGIAKNICYDHFRKEKRAQRHLETIADLLSRTQDGGDGKRDDQDALKHCLQKLPKHSSKLVSLRYEENRTSDDIARITDSTREAVRVSLLRIRTVLRDCMASQLAMEERS